MPNGTQYDLSTAVQDPDFLKAPTPDKLAFLSAHDADFAKASRQDKTAYLNHILGNDQPTQFEIANTPKAYYGFGASNLWENAKEGVSQLASGVYGLGKDVLFPQGQNESERLGFLANKYIGEPGAEQLQKARNAKTLSEKAGYNAAAHLPFLGPWAASLGEQAGTQDVGGALARGGTQVAAMEAAKPVLRAAGTGIGMAREGLRNTSFKELPRNGPQLTKGANRVGRAVGTLAGGGVGAATGIPGAGYAGGVAGFELGPSLIEKILGKPELGDVRNPAPFSKVPMRVKVRPEPEPVQTSPFQGMASSAKPGGADLQLPWLPRTAPTEPAVEFVSKFGPKKNLIQDPNSPPPDVRVTYQSVPQPDLLRMVRNGDMDAIAEWRRRGLQLPANVGFLTENGAGNLPWRRARR